VTLDGVQPKGRLARHHLPRGSLTAAPNSSGRAHFRIEPRCVGQLSTSTSPDRCGERLLGGQHRVVLEVLVVDRVELNLRTRCNNVVHLDDT